MLVWDPEAPAASPIELGRHDGWVGAVAVLPGGRMVTSGEDGRALVWDPDDPGAAAAKRGRHKGGVEAVAVLPGGLVVTSGEDGRVLVWDPDNPGAEMLGDRSCHSRTQPSHVLSGNCSRR